MTFYAILWECNFSEGSDVVDNVSSPVKAVDGNMESPDQSLIGPTGSGVWLPGFNLSIIRLREVY